MAKNVGTFKSGINAIENERKTNNKIKKTIILNIFIPTKK